MSQRLVVAIPDEHYHWLMEISKKNGLDTVQDAAREVIADCYKQKKRIKPGKRCGN